MKRITVEVREDHLENLAQTKPILALAELIWNALDAEATETRVEFVENEMQGLETIRVVDNGHGLHSSRPPSRPRSSGSDQGSPRAGADRS